jgi:hypothetical protein
MKKPPITISQLTAIHTLLSKHSLKDEKASIVEAFSAGRTTSSKELRFAEAAALIGHLKSLEPTVGGAEKMRNKILSMAHEMNWRHEGTQRVDMDHVNNWCLSRGYIKKKLDDYTYNELPKLVTQFEEVYKSYLKGALTVLLILLLVGCGEHVTYVWNMKDIIELWALGIFFGGALLVVLIGAVKEFLKDLFKRK